jgi:hypothetical protein
VKKRVRVGLRLGAKQLRQFSDIGGDPASFVFGHQVGAGAPPQLAFVVDVRHRKAVRVFDNEARAVGFLELPGRREATVRYQVQSSSSSRRVGGIYVANGDFNGRLDVSTFLSSFLAFFTAFFSFFACFRSPFVILDIRCGPPLAVMAAWTFRHPSQVHRDR